MEVVNWCRVPVGLSQTGCNFGAAWTEICLCECGGGRPGDDANELSLITELYTGVNADLKMTCTPPQN